MSVPKYSLALQFFHVYAGIELAINRGSENAIQKDTV